MASIFKLFSILLLVLHICTILGSPIETYPNSSNTEDTDTNAITPWKKVKLPPIFKKSAFLGRILKRKRIIPVTSNETALSSSSNVTSSMATQIVRPQRHVLFPGDHHHEEDHHEETFSQGLLNITNALIKPWAKYNSRLSKTAGTLPELFAAKGKLVGTVIATPIHLATYTLNRLANRITKTMNQNSVVDSNPENTDSVQPEIDPRNANPNAAAEELIKTLESIRKAYDARLSELNVKIRENVPVLEKPFEQVHGSVSGVLAETIREFGKSLHHLGAHMKRTGKSVSNLATKFKAFNTNPVEREPKVPNVTETVVAVTPMSNETNVESRIETPDDAEAVVVVGDGFQLEPRNSSVSIDSRQESNLTTQNSNGANETVVVETSTLVTSGVVVETNTTTPMISNVVESTTNESNTVSSVESIADSVETTSPISIETSTVAVAVFDGTTVSPIRLMNESSIESLETTVSTVQLLNQSIETTLLSVIESQESSTVAFTVLDGTTVSPVHSFNESSIESRESSNGSTTTTVSTVQFANQSIETTSPVIESKLETSTVEVTQNGTTVSPVQLTNQSVETVSSDVGQLEASTLENADIQEESIVPNETLTTVSSFVDDQSVETTAFVVESLENSTTFSTVQFSNQSVVEVSNPFVDSSLRASTVDATATVLPVLNQSVETTTSLVESLETSTIVSIVQFSNDSDEATLTQSVDSLETSTVTDATATVSPVQFSNQSVETILDSTTVSPVQPMNESTIKSLETTVSTVQLSNQSIETRTSPVTESPETATPHVVTTVSPNVNMFNESVESSTTVSTVQPMNQSVEATTLDGSTVSPVQSMNESTIESLETIVPTIQILNQSVETTSPVVESLETSSVDATSSVSPVQSMNRSVETQTVEPLETSILNSDIQEESIVLNETLTTVSPLMIEESVETTTSLWIEFVEPSTVDVALDGTTVSPVLSMNESTIESRENVQSTTVAIESVETIPSLVVDNFSETSSFTVSTVQTTLSKSTNKTESRADLIETTTTTLNESTQINDSTTPASVDNSTTVSTVSNQSTVSSVDSLKVLINEVSQTTVLSIEEESATPNEITTSITVSTVDPMLLNRSDETETELPIDSQPNDSLSITTPVSTEIQESVNATEVPQVFTTVSTSQFNQSNDTVTEIPVDSQLNTSSLNTFNESTETSTIVLKIAEPLNETITNSSTIETESSTVTVSIESSSVNGSTTSESTHVFEVTTTTSEQSNLSYIDQGLISAVETTTLASVEFPELNQSVTTTSEVNETMTTVVDVAISAHLDQIVETTTQIETKPPTTVSPNESTAQSGNASESTEQHHIESVSSSSTSTPIPTSSTEMYFQKSAVLPRVSDFETNNFQLMSPAAVNRTNKNNSDCKFASFSKNLTRKV